MHVVSVSQHPSHLFSKRQVAQIVLLEGLGVAGDAHAGATVQHRSRVARDPSQPNLRQVHLIHAELFDELAGQGFAVGSADLGENICTRGLALLDLPPGTELQLGDAAVIRITGLRNPCVQLDQFQAGLTAALLSRAPDGSLVRKAGVMAVVLRGGVVQAGDTIRITWPAEPHQRLVCV